MARKKGNSFWEVLRLFPPYYVRIWARRPGRCKMKDAALWDEHISIGSGIPLWRVKEISAEPNWLRVTVGELLAFTLACNFDPMDARCRLKVSQYEYVCKTRNMTPFRWLRKSPKWESQFLPLVKLMKSSIGQLHASAPITTTPKRSAA